MEETLSLLVPTLVVAVCGALNVSVIFYDNYKKLETDWHYHTFFALQTLPE